MDNDALPEAGPLTNIQVVRAALMTHPEVESKDLQEALGALDIIENELGQLRRVAGPRVMGTLLKVSNRYEALRTAHISRYPRMTLAEFDQAADELIRQQGATMNQPEPPSESDTCPS